MAAFLSAEMTTWIFVGLLVVLVVVLLVVPMFTNKKRAKQTMDLHNSLMPGDVIKTVGGVIGTIKEIKQISPTDREMIIETGEGDNKTTMTFDIQALYQIIERAARPESSETVSSEKTEAEIEHVDAASEAKADAPVEEKEQVAEATETKA
ncbi:MAG: preprotein translocase subunit YajC [Clostridiales bacterium]|nr:preprotein translocase subunit YajC [Clostridiales bacterium]